MSKKEEGKQGEKIIKEEEGIDLASRCETPSTPAARRVFIILLAPGTGSCETRSSSKRKETSATEAVNLLDED